MATNSAWQCISKHTHRKTSTKPPPLWKLRDVFIYNFFTDRITCGGILSLSLHADFWAARLGQTHARTFTDEMLLCSRLLLPHHARAGQVRECLRDVRFVHAHALCVNLCVARTLLHVRRVHVCCSRAMLYTEHFACVHVCMLCHSGWLAAKHSRAQNSNTFVQQSRAFDD